ncbi:unnamed protein product [Rotaria sordida]|nr:unnamed protein product [Rotaria sordida]
MTGIKMEPDNTRSLSSKHMLDVTAMMSGIGVIQQRQHNLYYSCSTDRCNDANVFKRILESLSLNSKFNELEGLLNPENPFDGNQCFRYMNQTDESCSSTTDIDPSKCKQCLTTVKTETEIDKICATCSTDDAYEGYLSNEIHFNMTDQTRILSWSIACQSKGCNTLDTGRQIRQKSDISFDFNKFLHSNSSGEQTISSSLIKFASIIILFIIKTFY